MAKADIEFFLKLREHPPPEIKSKDKHHYFTTTDGEDELNVEKMNQEESQVVSLDE
jgi:hypothetical protein